MYPIGQQLARAQWQWPPKDAAICHPHNILGYLTHRQLCSLASSACSYGQLGLNSIHWVSDLRTKYGDHIINCPNEDILQAKNSTY